MKVVPSESQLPPSEGQINNFPALSLKRSYSSSRLDATHGRGTQKAHGYQLNVKATLEQAFRDCLICLVPSLRLRMPNERLRLKTCGSAAMKEHFQPEAGNEVLKEF